MTREQAKQALSSRHPITHNTFFTLEYYQCSPWHTGFVLFRDDGIIKKIREQAFWDTHSAMIFNNGWHYGKDNLRDEDITDYSAHDVDDEYKFSKKIRGRIGQ